MKGQYIVSEISGDKITVTPFSPSSGERGKIIVSHISVINPKKLEISTGSVVTIGFSQAMENFQEISALLFPVILAFIGYVFYSLFLFKAGNEESGKNELFRFLFVLGFFTAGSLIVFIRSRTNRTILRPEITAVLKSEEN